MFAKTGVAIMLALQLGVAAAIAAIVALHLNNVSISVSSGSASVTQGTCLLGTAGGGNLCLFAYLVAGVGGAIAIISTIFACLTCACCCGIGHVFDLVLNIVGAAWYAGSGALLTTTAFQQPAKDFPEGTWRTVTWILCWVGAGLFVIMAIISGALMCNACRGGRRDKKKKPLAGDVEAAAITSDGKPGYYDNTTTYNNDAANMARDQSPYAAPQPTTVAPYSTSTSYTAAPAPTSAPY